MITPCTLLDKSHQKEINKKVQIKMTNNKRVWGNQIVGETGECLNQVRNVAM